MTHDELRALAEEVRVMSGYGKTGEAISALAVGTLTLLDEIDTLNAYAAEMREAARKWRDRARGFSKTGEQKP